MSRKNTTLEVVCYVIAYLLGFSAIVSILGAVGGLLNGELVPVLTCFVLWLHTVVMFKGLNERNSACMKIIKWFNVFKCFLLVVLAALLMTLYNDPEVLDPSLRSVAIGLTAGEFVVSTSIACITYRLQKYYEHLQQDYQETV